MNYYSSDKKSVMQWLMVKSSSTSQLIILLRNSTRQRGDYTIRWLPDYLYFNKKLSTDCNRFKQIKFFWCWFKSNSTNWTFRRFRYR